MFKLLQSYLTQQTPLAQTLLEPFLNPESFQACRGYFLPKLQKMGLPLPISPPLIAGRTPPMRPICASIGWVTYAVSVLLDIILKPIMLRLDSYIMSSATIAKELNTTTFPINCALLSADVDSLYPSIDINRGLDAINEALIEAKTPSTDREFTIFLLRWVLYNNVIEFNGKLYLQIRGTAMGTPCAVVFACIFMGMLERKALSLARERLMIPLYYKRFIDDILIIARSLQECQLLQTILNEMDKTINTTGTPSNENTNFLDIIIYKGPEFADTQIFDLDLYQKPSNKFLFLPHNSEHAPHVFQGWVTGYIQRLRINITNDYHYYIKRIDFWTQLAERGYPAYKLDQYFSYYPQRHVLLQNIRTRPKPLATREAFIVFKIRMSTRTMSILKQLKKALDIIPIEHELGTYHNPKLKQILRNRIRPIICFHNSKNIGKSLITAKLHNNNALKTTMKTKQSATTYPQLQAYVRSTT
jgi:hypothetical protein